MVSPVRAISTARLRPRGRATATIGVWQNSPPLPPGVAKAASLLATIRSALAASWGAGRGGQGVHLGHHHLGDLGHGGHG